MGYNSPCGCCIADLKMKEEKKDKPTTEWYGYECCFDDCEEIFKYGNNALPLREAKCCDECNSTKVIPARMFRDFLEAF